MRGTLEKDGEESERREIRRERGRELEVKFGEVRLGAFRLSCHATKYARQDFGRREGLLTLEGQGNMKRSPEEGSVCFQVLLGGAGASPALLGVALLPTR